MFGGSISCLVIGVGILDEDVEDSAWIRNGDLRFLGVGSLDDVVLRKRSWQDTPRQRSSKDYSKNFLRWEIEVIKAQDEVKTVASLFYNSQASVPSF